MTNTNTNTNQPRTPDEALAQWHQKVDLLEEWERAEINIVYRHLTQIMEDHQSSAALAIVRMSLEISRQQQTMQQAQREAARQELEDTILAQFGIDPK